MKVLGVVGARPNFVKMAPLAWALRRRPAVEFYLVHTGQHYDRTLSDTFFDELRIPQPNVNLNVGGGSHATQTAEVMKRIEPVLLEQHPDIVIVVGDVNSTIASALTAVKLGIPVAHVEAGLRSFDNSMPEEINRRLTDQISRWLFVTERTGVENLRHEGLPTANVFLVGNVMIDTLFSCRDRIEGSSVLQRLNVSRANYCLLTLHRPSNVDEPGVLRALLDGISRISERIPVIFPAHPRTVNALHASGWSASSTIRIVEPLGYLDFLKLQADARVVLTDSGGVQEETTALGVRCLTLRDNTERPITVEQGTNTLVGRDPSAVVSATMAVLEENHTRTRRLPELWDGNAADRIVEILLGTQKQLGEPCAAHGNSSAALAGLGERSSHTN